MTLPLEQYGDCETARIGPAGEGFGSVVANSIPDMIQGLGEVGLEDLIGDLEKWLSLENGNAPAITDLVL